MFTSGHSSLIGIKLVLLTINTYITGVRGQYFQILKNRQSGNCLWEKGNFKVTFTIAMTFCLKALSRPRCKQSEGVLLNWGERLGARAAEVAGGRRTEYCREGSLHREGAPALFSGVPTSHSLNIKLCLWGQEPESSELNTDSRVAGSHWNSDQTVTCGKISGRLVDLQRVLQKERKYGNRKIYLLKK